MFHKPLDLLTIGRSGVDLYGAQVGGRLEDMGSFRKHEGKQMLPILGPFVIRPPA